MSQVGRGRGSPSFPHTTPHRPALLLLQAEAHPCGARAHNPRISTPTPCPSGQGGIKRDQASQSTEHSPLATSAVWVSGVGLIGSSKASDPAPPPPPRPRAPPLRATATATSSEEGDVTPVGFEPTQLALVEFESTPLDHSGKVSWSSKSH